MKLTRFIAAMVLVLVATLYAGAFINLAHAQDAVAPSTEIIIPWGNWLSDAASTVVMVVGAIVAWGLRLLPARILAVVQTAQLDQLLLKAIDFGVNKTAGASKGRELNIDVANSVLAESLQYAITNAPGWMVAWAGGELALRDKIIARLEVKADVALK
jgi:hypothetical protein